jgi:hypothetical protein
MFLARLDVNKFSVLVPNYLGFLGLQLDQRENFLGKPSL